MLRRVDRVIIAVSLGLVLEAGGADAGRPKDFGARWVRSHPFTIMGVVQKADHFKAEQYREAGLNVLLAWKSPPGLLEEAVKHDLPWMGTAIKKNAIQDPDRPLTDEIRKRVRELSKKHPGCVGWILWDEPYRSHFQKLGEAIALFKSEFPECLVQSNLYCIANPGKLYGGKWISSGVYEAPPRPFTYDDYIAEYLRVCRPDVLMFDTYPFEREGISFQHSYFSSLEAIRAAGLKAALPYWTFVQSYQQGKPGGGGSQLLPSESDIRMQVFSALTYGFTGIAYFVYEPGGFTRGLLEPDGLPSPLFAASAQLNTEVKNLGRALRFLTSRDVRFVPGRHYGRRVEMANHAPEDVRVFDPAVAREWGIEEVVMGEKTADYNALLGLFQDDAGGRYFMLMSLRRASRAAAEDITLPLTLKLTPAVKTLTRLSRATGKVEAVGLEKGAVKLILPGGTGELFKINDTRFPGLDDR